MAVYGFLNEVSNGAIGEFKSQEAYTKYIKNASDPDEFSAIMQDALKSGKVKKCNIDWILNGFKYEDNWEDDPYKTYNRFVLRNKNSINTIKRSDPVLIFKNEKDFDTFQKYIVYCVKNDKFYQMIFSEDSFHYEIGNISYEDIIKEIEEYEEAYGEAFTEDTLNEGLHLFNKNKKGTKQIQQKPNPLSPEQKADAKKIIAEIKKIAPSVISDMNKNKDYMNALNAAVDEVDWDPDDDIEDDVKKKLKPVSRKWVCSEFKPFDNKENQLVVCCMDKSIMDAYYLMSDAGYVDHHFNKYSRTPIYNAGKEIVSKLTDTYGLKVNVDGDSIDGCILFIISA